MGKLGHNTPIKLQLVVWMTGNQGNLWWLFNKHFKGPILFTLPLFNNNNVSLVCERTPQK